jgi:hypothetical protein
MRFFRMPRVQNLLHLDSTVKVGQQTGVRQFAICEHIRKSTAIRQCAHRALTIDKIIPEELKPGERRRLRRNRRVAKYA